MLSPGLYEEVAAIVADKTTDIDEASLKRSVDKVDIYVSRYCRLRALPLEMKYIIADMVVDVFKMDNQEEPTEDQDDFSSRITKLTQGDTTIELGTASTEVSFKSMKEVMAAYKDDLFPYRGVFWR